MKIGILGGTFNPVHIAHLRIAEEVRERFELDRVIFVPAATPQLNYLLQKEKAVTTKVVTAVGSGGRT